MSKFGLKLVRTVVDVETKSRVEYYVPIINDASGNDEASGQIEYKTDLTPEEIVVIEDNQW